MEITSWKNSYDISKWSPVDRFIFLEYVIGLSVDSVRAIKPSIREQTEFPPNKNKAAKEIPKADARLEHALERMESVQVINLILDTISVG